MRFNQAVTVMKRLQSNVRATYLRVLLKLLGVLEAENAQNEKSEFRLKRFGRIKAKLGPQAQKIPASFQVRNRLSIGSET
jgi:uncharacterized protein YigA (DUF484 family)